MPTQGAACCPGQPAFQTAPMENVPTFYFLDDLLFCKPFHAYCARSITLSHHHRLYFIRAADW